MIESGKVKKILYGGDYNPEQWGEDVWGEDMRLFKLAHIDVVTLNVFSWASLQPDENSYTFDQLDKIMNMVRQNGLQVCLATSTAHHPAWMAKKYPEILRTEFSGTPRKFGGRHNSCPNSLVYHKYSVGLAKELAKRYGTYENIVAWHISNEYFGECFCENCEKAFRVWLKNRYQTLEKLNRAWNTSFWGHTFYDWDEVVLPNIQSEHFAYERTMFQGISLDYRRFNSDSMMNCFRMEYDAIKEYTPDIPITTNLMGFYKPLDYQKWGKYMDFISWDSYPAPDSTIAQNSMNHAMMRGLKQGKPFCLMEQTPSVTNWQPYNSLKRPNVMRLLSYQAVAQGSDTVMFFQMRRSVGACEKYHGAVIDHAGHENTRVFREITALGKELEIIGSKTLGSRLDAKAAIVMDWDNWWAIEYSAGPSIELKYCDELLNYYTALHKRNIMVDMIGTEDDLSQYDLVIAPVLYMIKGNYDEKLREYVRKGGSFVTTFFSGYVDENDLVTIGGYPGKLRDILGLWVEESDAQPEGVENQFVYQGKQYPAKLLFDLLHLEGAESFCGYEKDFYAGMPVLTKNQFGKGMAYYVATRSNEEFYFDFLKDICEEKGIIPVQETPGGVEATLRKNAQGEFLFLLNHSEKEEEVTLQSDGTDLITGAVMKAGERIKMMAKDVKIIHWAAFQL